MTVSKYIFMVPALMSVFASTARAQDTGYLPIGWVDVDIENKLISQSTAAQNLGNSIEFTSPDSNAGFRQVKTQSLDLKAGVYGGWYLNNGTFAASLFGAGAALIPVVGSTVVSDRRVQSKQEADSLSDRQIPAEGAALKDWKEHDSIFYDNRGGVIFAVGVGYAFTGLSGDYFAQGEWSTYIEKLENNKVYVKVSSISLDSLDAMLGNFAANVMVSDFGKTDKMFSYIFDLSDARSVAAYEAMIHGSMKEAEALATQCPALAQLDLTEKGDTSGYETKLFFGIPFLNVTLSSGSLNNFSDTVYHLNNSKTDVEYGLYWNENHSDVFSHHQSASQSFYGIAYTTKYANGTSDQGKYGKTILSYENDGSDESTVHDAMADMIQRTGMRDQLKYEGSALQGISGYIHLSLVMEIPEVTTKKLIELNSNGALDQLSVSDSVQSYFTKMGDPEKYCDPSVITNTVEGCQSDYADNTQDAVNDMKSALSRMRGADQAGDNVEFAKAYSAFGKAMLTNEFSFQMVKQLTGGSPLDVTFQAEGSQIAQITKVISGNQVPANLVIRQRN